MNVGQRIRQLRTKNNLTQEELASRCELTKGYLSQLENDLATPSLPTLQDIVVALGTNMSQFFKEDERQEKVTFEEEDFFVDEKDGYTIRWIVPNAQKNEMEPILVEIRPGEDSQLMQPHEGEEFGYVLNGRVILVNGKERALPEEHRKPQRPGPLDLHPARILNTLKTTDPLRRIHIWLHAILSNSGTS